VQLITQSRGLGFKRHSDLGGYLAECHPRRGLGIRIIQGKGIDDLRRTVHAQLAKHLLVDEFNPVVAGWGATMVKLKSQARGNE